MIIKILEQISKDNNIQLYLYNKVDNSLIVINSNQGANTAPNWITNLANSGLSRKSFQKDGVSYSCYCFNIFENNFIIFQDSLDGDNLNIFIKSLLNLKTTSQNSQDNSDELKKEIVKIKSEILRITGESKKKDNIIEELKKQPNSQNNQEVDRLKKIIRELTDTNNSQANQIARMKADTEYMNFQKLKKVNADLRSEVTAIQFKAAENENRLNKTRKVLQNTMAELSRFTQMSRVDQSDVRNLITKISSGEMEDAPVSVTGGASKLVASIQQDKNISLTGAKFSASSDNNPSLTGAKLTASLDNNPSLTGAKLTASLDNDPSLTGAKLTASLENNPSLTGARYIGENDASSRQSRPRDMTDIVNALNSYIARNDSTGINIDKLATIVPISNKDSIKNSPAVALKSLVGTLIGMSKASKLSSLQIAALCDALGIR